MYLPTSWVHVYLAVKQFDHCQTWCDGIGCSHQQRDGFKIAYCGLYRWCKGETVVVISKFYSRQVLKNDLDIVSSFGLVFGSKNHKWCRLQNPQFLGTLICVIHIMLCDLWPRPAPMRNGSDVLICPAVWTQVTNTQRSNWSTMQLS